MRVKMNPDQEDNSFFAGVPGVLASEAHQQQSSPPNNGAHQPHNMSSLPIDISSASDVNISSENLIQTPPPTTISGYDGIISSTGRKIWNNSSAWLLKMSSQSSTNVSSTYRDPSQVERSNLLNITKLVIKELIEYSVRHSRSLDSDHPPLQHFFIVLEHAMRHGLKPKKGLLGPKKELWDVLQLVEKCTTDASDITNSIRDLPTVNTHLGRARAWLKLALMQKKLADYFKILVDNRDDLLKEFYEPFALLNSEESTLLAGLLVGLNIIDCNFCLKDEDLDCQQGVIDFSLYLRSSKSTDSIGDENILESQKNIDSVLDQKNYIEELNRHLNATVTSLQTKYENQLTTNALMREDLAISKNTISSLMEENRNFKLRLEQFTSTSTPDLNISTERNITSTSPLPANLSIMDLSKKLHEERQMKSDLEKEVEMMINQKAETSCAMKVLEKDLHDKQDIINSLRSQLDDIKLINLEMYKKLQECEKTLKYKAEMIVKLENKSKMLAETIDNLDEKLKGSELELKKSRETIRNLLIQITEKENTISNIEGDLKIEREFRQSIEKMQIKDKETISELNLEVKKIEQLKKELASAHKESEEFRKRCREQEETLVDMGTLLKEQDLRMDQLKESSKAYLDAHWAKDKDAKSCKSCNKDFTLTIRKHHCRNCGEIFCKLCSDNTMSLPSFPKPVRVCDPCSLLLLERCSNLPSPSTTSSTTHSAS